MRKEIKPKVEHKPHCRALLTILAVVLFVGNTLATTYYVRVTGDDGNAGTSPATAFKKIGKAADEAVAGDTIYVGAGVYVDDVTPNNNGTSGSRITCIADTTGAFTGDAGTV